MVVSVCFDNLDLVMVTVLSDYTVIVQTADKWGAGTDATVKIKVEGTKGIAERNLEGSFERGE